MTKPLILAALAAAFALPAAAQTLGDGAAIRAEDMARLDALDRATGAALRQALGQGTDEQAADATRALRGAALPADRVTPDMMAGEWSCTMTKIGGNLPAVSYPPFRCHFGADEQMLSFEKMTGSQRTTGFFHRDGDAWIYLGSSFVAGEQPKIYADFPAQIDTQATETLPDVGVLEVLSDKRARILFPLPYRESVLNVLTLSR